MKVRDIIKESLGTIGVLGEGETPSATQSSSCLLALRSMLEYWSTNGLLIYKYERNVFPLVSGQEKYSVGTMANFATIRPVNVEYAKASELETILTELTPFVPGDPLADPPVPDTPATYSVEYKAYSEYPVEILNIQRWADITDKRTQAKYVYKIYFEGDAPTDYVHVWPVPNEATALVFYSQEPLSDFDSINDDVLFPPGYTEAIIYSLALRLAPRYGKSPDPMIMKLAEEALAQIQRQNYQPVFMESDAFGLTHHRCMNIFTGK